MLQRSILTPADLAEDVKRQKRAQYEEQRKKAIFNAKNRLFGVDTVALERQIAEKSKQKQTQAECDLRFEQQTSLRQNVIRAKELEQERQKQVAQSDLNFYRCRLQRLDQRREFDLNDPNALKKGKPARVGDNDIHLGISSAQVFAGEDLGGRDRLQRQRAQQRAWLDQQMREKQQADNARKEADKQWQTSLVSHDQRLEDMSNNERRVRNEILEAVRQYNSDLAKRKRDDALQAKKEKHEDDLAEIYNMLTSDMLTENPDVANSPVDPNKKIAFMYRGMTPAELATFRKEQNRQLIANRKRDVEKEALDKQWEQYMLNMDRELQLKDIEVERKKKELLDQQIEHNKQLAEEQRGFREAEKRAALKSTPILPVFYAQFNKTTR